MNFGINKDAHFAKFCLSLFLKIWIKLDLNDSSVLLVDPMPVDSSKYRFFLSSYTIALKLLSSE